MNCCVCFRTNLHRLQNMRVPVYRRNPVRDVRVPGAGRRCPRRVRLGVLLQKTAALAGRLGATHRAFQVSCWNDAMDDMMHIVSLQESCDGRGPFRDQQQVLLGAGRLRRGPGHLGRRAVRAQLQDLAVRRADVRRALLSSRTHLPEVRPVPEPGQRGLCGQGTCYEWFINIFWWCCRVPSSSRSPFFLLPHFLVIVIDFGIQIKFVLTLTNI